MEVLLPPTWKGYKNQKLDFMCSHFFFIRNIESLVIIMTVVTNAPETKRCLSEVRYVIVFVLHLCDNRDPSALM